MNDAHGRMINVAVRRHGKNTNYGILLAYGQALPSLQYMTFYDINCLGTAANCKNCSRVLEVLFFFSLVTLK